MQEHELRAYCDRRGWGDSEAYTDQISGAKFVRPGLDALLAAVRSGKIERVVVFKLDRLGRSLPHLALILDELARHGVALIATSQGIDTSNSNPVGRLQLNVLMAVAEFERGLIRERVHAGLAAARAARRWRVRAGDGNKRPGGPFRGGCVCVQNAISSAAANAKGGVAGLFGMERSVCVIRE